MVEPHSNGLEATSNVKPQASTSLGDFVVCANIWKRFGRDARRHKTLKIFNIQPIQQANCRRSVETPTVDLQAPFGQRVKWLT